MAIALERRAVEAELDGQRLHRFGRRGRAEHDLGRVARQDVEHREDDDRRGEQGRDEGREALEQEEADGGLGRGRRVNMMAQSAHRWRSDDESCRHATHAVASAARFAIPFATDVRC